MGLQQLIQNDGTFGLLWQMGIGKSRVTIDYLGWLAHSTGQEVRVLVTAPRSVQDVWPLEVEKWASESVLVTCQVLAGGIEEKARFLSDWNTHTRPWAPGKGSVHICVVNYEALSSRREMKGRKKLHSDMWLDAIKKYAPHVLVVEEAHNLKNPDSNVGRLMYRVAKQVKRRILLTGTPMPHALPVNEPVLTPIGWKPMGDIQVGDTVVGSDGLGTEVVGVWPQGLRRIKTVLFSDGSRVRCTEDHLWQVTTRGRRSKGLPPLVKKTSELGAAPESNPWTVPTVSPVQMPRQDVPVDPYLLGVLIGDGHIGSYVGFTSMDEEIVKRAEDALPLELQLTPKACAGSKAMEYRITSGTRGGSEKGDRRGPAANPLMVALESLGLRGTHSTTKFIPELYLWNDVETRLALLQGICDTDGSSCGSTTRYTTTSPRLAADVRALVQSLGGLVTERIEDKRGTILPNGSLVGFANLQYVLSFGLPFNPFHVSRKADKWEPRWRDRSRRIIAVLEDRPEVAQCITVAAEDGLFVTRDFVVTHNSPLDVYSQFRILDDTVFSTFGKPWSNGQFVTHFAKQGGYMGKQIMGFRNLDELERKMATRSSSLRTRDCIDLPPVQDIEVPLRLSARGQRAYDRIKKEMVLELESGTLMSAPSMLTLRLRLRQLACGFVKDDETGAVEWVDTTRLDAAVERIEALLATESRVVVFDWSTAEIAELSKRLGSLGDVMTITGETVDSKRREYLARFVKRDETKRIVIGQWRCVSTGINQLVSASHAVIMSLPETRADYEQAKARLDRPGQEGSKVVFHHMVVQNTVDTAILHAHKTRTSLENAVLEYLRKG